jgi:hypothetical protein
MKRKPNWSAAALPVLVAVIGGCSHVAPYERSKLAHPTMRPVDEVTAGEGHVREVTEGGVDANVGSGSGCGCN